jgi:hypothetical protein
LDSAREAPIAAQYWRNWRRSIPFFIRSPYGEERWDEVDRRDRPPEYLGPDKAQGDPARPDRGVGCGSPDYAVFFSSRMSRSSFFLRFLGMS